MGEPEVRYPRSEHCAVCDRATTHVRQGCTRCMGRGDNRKQGVLFAVLGGGLFVLGLSIFTVSRGAIQENREARDLSDPEDRPPPRRVRRAIGMVPLGGILAMVGGAVLTIKGLKGVVLGRDPEA